MKRYLYILKYKTTPLLIFENEKMKYFEEDNKEVIKDLEKYLKDKIEYDDLIVTNEKEAIYYGEEYVISIIEIVNLKEIEDNKNIKQLNAIKNEELDYRDEMFLKTFYTGGIYNCNYKYIKVNDQEKKDIKLNIILAIVIAITSMIFFVGKDKINYFGISVPIITMLILLVSIFTMGKIKKINYMGLYFTIISILLSITYGIFDNSVFRTINIIIIPISLLTGLYMINFYNIQFNFSQLFNNILPSITINIINNSYMKNIGKIFRERDKFLNNKNKGIIKGIFISIPLLIVLIMLLASADQMFQHGLENIAMYVEDLFINFNFIFVYLKIIVFTLVFIYMFYIFSSFKFRIDNSKVKNIKKLEKNMVNTILILINALYFLFTYIQVKYLYIKSNNILTPEEYSNYARSGFFQLMIVVVLNIIIIIYFENRVKDSKLTTILNTVTIIISINMGLTSIYKMILYISQFGMTRLRFMTSIFMIFILIMLLIITVSLWKYVELFKWFIIVGSIIYISINFCNMDKIIAKYNLSEKVKEVDISYLSTLSIDSYDVVLEAFKDGKIDKEQFAYYRSKKTATSKWYEYNYYNNKM